MNIYPNIDSEKSSVNRYNVCYGIDLGTTTTLVCSIDPNNVDKNRLITLPIQFLKIPQYSPLETIGMIEDEKVASIVAIYDGKPFVGKNLHSLKGDSRFEFKKNIFYHWKLELGIDQEPMYPNAITEKLNMPFKIAGGILNYIRKTRFNENELPNTIITVPASFQVNQRKDVIKAAKMARIQINDNMLIDEPNAAFLGYFNRLSDDEKKVWAQSVKNKNLLVVDFGGGTLDLSILNIDFRNDVGITIGNIAISRYNDLGGQDIDDLISEEFLFSKLKNKLTELDLIDLVDIKNIILPQLSVIAEELKIGICNNLNIRAADKSISKVEFNDISYEHKNCVITYRNNSYDLGCISIKASEFKDLFYKLFNGKSYKFKYIDKTVCTISDSINNIINKAEVKLDEIEYILFVGGSSFNPFLHSLCSEKLSNAKVLISNEPDKLVAEGAAVYSYFYNIHNVSLINPITSDTIGVILKDKKFYPIIEKGISLPKKIYLPDFRLQTNLTNEIIVPVAINSNNFIIGEIKATLKEFYPLETIVTIEAEITTDKIFKLNVIIDNKIVAKAEFNNIFGNKAYTDEELQLNALRIEYNNSKVEGNYSKEKTTLRSLITKHFDVGDYSGCLQCAEEYCNQFDDQDQFVWNYRYITNRKLGRENASINALEKALSIDKNSTTLNYNYSILLEDTNGQKAALEYLENLDDTIKNYIDIKLRIILLKNYLNIDVTKDASDMIESYKNQPNKFSNFSKKNLLKNIFKLCNEEFAYVDPSNKINNSDESKYLDSNNLPF